MPPPAYVPKKEISDLAWLEAQSSVYCGRYPIKKVWFVEVTIDGADYEGLGATFADALLAVRLAVMDGRKKQPQAFQGNEE